MSTDYGLQDRVPTDILAKRLQELSIAITEGKEAMLREFTMRVPAECDRDADLVLSAAAKRLLEFMAAERQGVSIEPKRLVIGPATAPATEHLEWIIKIPLNQDNLPEVPDTLEALDKLAKAACIPPYTHFQKLLAKRSAAPATAPEQPSGKFKIGDHVRKVKGSQWRGRIVGWYSTELTSVGWAVESDTERGSVQIYPEAALELVKYPTI